MPVVIPVSLVSVDLDSAAPTRTITADVNGQSVMLTGSSTDVAALAVPGAASLTLSQP